MDFKNNLIERIIHRANNKPAELYHELGAVLIQRGSKWVSRFGSQRSFLGSSYDLAYKFSVQFILP